MDKTKIYELLPLVAADIGAVGKDGNNQQQGYKYRAIDDVLNASHAALVKHGITAIPVVIDQKREERQGRSGGTLLYSILTVRYTFYAPDGSSVECVVIGEGMDSGDKASNKAMSAAYKYAIGQVFSIPFETVDSEKDNPEPAPKPTPRTTPATPPPASTAPDRAKLIKSFGELMQGVAHDANVPPSDLKKMTDEWLIQVIKAPIEKLTDVKLNNINRMHYDKRNKVVEWAKTWNKAQALAEAK